MIANDTDGPPEDSSTDKGDSFSKVAPWIALVGLMFLLTYLDRAMFGPLLPAMEAEFGISHAASTRFLLYISLGYSISMFLSGFSSSKVRPRIMVSGALLCTGATLLVIAVNTNFSLMPFLFFVLGASAGQYFNGGMSTMRSLVRPAQWSKAISIHEIGPNASFFLGPILAGIAASWLGWRGMVSVMGWVTIAAGLIFMVIAKGGDYPAAPVSFTGFTKALKQPRLWLFTWLMGLAIAGEFAPFSVLTMHMTEERMLTPGMAAFLLSASRVAAPFAVLCGGWVTTRLGTRRTLLIAFAAYACGMFLMATPFMGTFIAGMFLQPVLTAMVFPPIFTLLAESFPLRDQPLFLAIGMPVASFLGVGVMPPVLGIFGDVSSFAAGFAVMGALVSLSFPLLKLMPVAKR